MNPLVVYYSQTGTTEKIAKCIADELRCKSEAIRDTKKRSGPIGFLRSGWSARKKKLTKIKDIDYDPSTHDIVIIGTPVWASNISTPVRTFLHRYRDSLTAVAFFATHGGEDAQNVFQDMEELCGKEPRAVVSFSGKEVKEGNYRLKIENFVRDMKS
jgi:menaquinone-dependent protoporphyrinogen IX oxidase